MKAIKLLLSMFLLIVCAFGTVACGAESAKGACVWGGMTCSNGSTENECRAINGVFYANMSCSDFGFGG